MFARFVWEHEKLFSYLDNYEKHRETKKDLHLIFIDLRRANGRGSRDWVLEK